jgi:amidophosphoribosyltransferase
MCGVIGFYSPGDDVFAEVVNGLFQMQHRGQDACGMALADGERLRLHKDVGYVREVFRDRPTADFRGHVGCGHVRYPTQGGNRLVNAQPHLVSTLEGNVLALASNGDVTNYWARRAELEAAGVEFVGTNDAELILKTIAWHHLSRGLDLVSAMRCMQAEVQGAYSACLITKDTLWALRDPFAIRPLSIGYNEVDARWVVASETTALDICRADLVDELAPGEIVRFAADGMTRYPHPDEVAARGGRATPAHCVFEYVYFSRPDSIAFGQRVYDVRKRIGAWLAEHDNVVGDVVVPVPDSSNAVALGYAQASGLPFEFGLVRNHYIGRTFISSEQILRDDGVKMKFNPLRSVFKGRRVILVDDSIVRGTTSRKLVRMVKAAGAAEVHLRVGSPVTRYSCYYGVDTPDARDLIGNRLSESEIAEYLTADSLQYMTIEGLRECVGPAESFCMACFDGKYPVPITEHKVALEVG